MIILTVDKFKNHIDDVEYHIGKSSIDLIDVSLCSISSDHLGIFNMKFMHYRNFYNVLLEKINYMIQEYY